MLESTPMPYKEHSNDACACQSAAHIPPFLEVHTVIAAVVRASHDAYPAAAVTSADILGPSRAAAIARARHLCAYLLMEDARLTCVATAKALGDRDHSTILHSRARVATALGHDAALADLLGRARAALAGRVDDTRLQVRCDERRRRGLEETSPHEWDEYRYWRRQALHAARYDATGGA